MGFGGTGAIVTVTEPLGDVFASVFGWTRRRGFRSYYPRLPFLSTLEQVELGRGLWIFVDDPAGALWTQPTIEGAREVKLESGFNLVMWSGPEMDAAEAVASIGGALLAIFVWDPLGQRFLAYNPSLPGPLNSASTLRYGDGVWVLTSGPATWNQPAP